MKKKLRRKRKKADQILSRKSFLLSFQAAALSPLLFLIGCDYLMRVTARLSFTSLITVNHPNHSLFIDSVKISNTSKIIPV